MAARVAFLLPLAWVPPSRTWSPACILLSEAAARLAPRGTARAIEQVRQRCGERDDLPAPHAIVTHTRAGRIERHLQYLRELRPDGWHPRVELTGAEHIDEALAKGHGCILWVAPTMYAFLVVKKGLSSAGYSLTHLSHIEHGLSQTRLGRPLSALRTKPEERYLAERLVMTDGSELQRTRDLYARLRANTLVSITAETTWGARMVSGPFLGSTISLPTGAPSLSLASGAALLPTFAIRHTHDHFEVIIEPALAAGPVNDRHAAVDGLARDYIARIDHHVSKHPEQYALWW
jgi:predicted LPLAT superfamily acyltransferase